jgi:hypothetical protein
LMVGAPCVQAAQDSGAVPAGQAPLPTVYGPSGPSPETDGLPQKPIGASGSDPASAPDTNGALECEAFVPAPNPPMICAARGDEQLGAACGCPYPPPPPGILASPPAIGRIIPRRSQATGR